MMMKTLCQSLWVARNKHGLLLSKAHDGKAGRLKQAPQNVKASLMSSDKMQVHFKALLGYSGRVFVPRVFQSFHWRDRSLQPIAPGLSWFS